MARYSQFRVNEKDIEDVFQEKARFEVQLKRERRKGNERAPLFKIITPKKFK